MSDAVWRGRSVLVTGGTGLLGGWLVSALLDRGAHIVSLVRDGVPGSRLVQEPRRDQVTTVYGALQDFGLLRRTLAEYDIKTVFHLAAQAIVSTARLDPLTTLETNVQGTWNVLEAARLAGQPQVIVASSDKAYGTPRELPYFENHPLEGRYPYDVSKSCADLIATMYSRTYGLPVAIARCANLFGGGDLNFSRIIPDAIRSTLRGEPCVIRSDGRFVRDFIYVKDAATAYLRLAEHLASRPDLSGEAFNFGLETRMTVLDVLHRILALMKRTDLQPVIQNTAAYEIREQYLSCEKARQLLGWQPTYSLEEALVETIDWYRKHLGTDRRKAATLA
jgi:CDP-glucose 4,6-dehydratase